ncbi:Uncharacterised protein [Chlamydia trachomatis]|nr:Uncharacterised protein [Chlamydia trachomatis]
MGAVVLVAKNIGNHVAYHNDAVGIFGLAPLSQSQCFFCKSSPFLTVVVGTMVGGNHAHSQQSGQWNAEAWSHGMHVYNIGVQMACLDDS